MSDSHLSERDTALHADIWRGHTLPGHYNFLENNKVQNKQESETESGLHFQLKTDYAYKEQGAIHKVFFFCGTANELACK